MLTSYDLAVNTVTQHLCPCSTTAHSHEYSYFYNRVINHKRITTLWRDITTLQPLHNPAPREDGRSSYQEDKDENCYCVDGPRGRLLPPASINTCSSCCPGYLRGRGLSTADFTRFLAGSRASHLMQASAFTKPQQNKDYQAFRSNFLETFGEHEKHSLVKGVNLAVELLHGGAASKDLFDGQVDANRISADFVKYLKDNGWTHGDTMQLPDVCKFLEFFVYMILLKGKCRRNSWSLNYTPAEELHDFVLKLKTKVEEKNGDVRMTASSVAVTSLTIGEEAPDSSYAAVTASGKPTLTCTYCQREGHTTNKYFIRVRDQREAKKKNNYRDASGPLNAQFTNRNFYQDETAPPRRQTRPTNTTIHKPHFSSPSGATGNSPYCSIHDSTTHYTDDCFTLLKIRDNFSRGRGMGGASSGESGRH
ncbi:hypothetical protein GWK47_036944 [Chionoecetes opilio]|uniref:Uncharacterized protein n=1 Tax=Chionoecetes opilio TaxID=41210 RepID=A0A8J4YM43_CHIOP|nr:hypothetical protein GWK47_036944 [Chionoecetes opilio]